MSVPAPAASERPTTFPPQTPPQLPVPFPPLSQSDTQSRQAGTRNVYLGLWGSAMPQQTHHAASCTVGIGPAPGVLLGGPRGSKQGSVA